MFGRSSGSVLTVEGRHRYTDQQRRSAVECYEGLLVEGLSQRQARRDAGSRWEVNPSSLRAWVERGVNWSSGGLGQGQTAGLSELQSEVVRLRTEVAELQAGLDQAYQEIDRSHGVRLELSAQDLNDAYAANEIWDQWVENYRCFGPARLFLRLRETGVLYSRRRVERLMSLCGTAAADYQRQTVRMWVLLSSQGLDRRASHWPKPKTLNQWWGVFVTKVATGAGQRAVVFVTDALSRQIIDWSVHGFDSAIDLKTVVAEVVAHTPGRNGIKESAHRSTSPECTLATDLTDDDDVRRLIGLDPRTAETVAWQLSGTLFQIECVGNLRTQWQTLTDVEDSVGRWATWFNTVRPHRALAGATPGQFEERHLGCAGTS